MKKHLVKILLAAGIVLVLAAVVIAVIKTSNTKIIGGADLPTFIYAFSSWKGGVCSNIAFVGICSLIASVVVKIINKKGKNTESR